MLRHDVKLIYNPNIAPNQSETFAIERTSAEDVPVPASGVRASYLTLFLELDPDDGGSDFEQPDTISFCHIEDHSYIGILKGLQLG